ncbi:MAG: HAD-IA family hydrolase [Candidatus Obscuribacterales bacterium]|nr:HAD-IA family hydrolase [Candidatus Obscuribacterales bacterium]
MQKIVKKQIKNIFSDVGGVLATNGWDHISRRKAAEQFNLDYEEFESYHQKVADSFDAGLITLTQYLKATVFYEARSFSVDDFFAFMKMQSQANSDALGVVKALQATGKYRLATINNESFELNDFRIKKFALADYFESFFSSCYMGLRKPEPEIYRRALLISNSCAEDSVFIDDREENLVAPKELNMQTILFVDAQQLRDSLSAIGVDC